MGFLDIFLGMLFLLICVLLIVVVLLQKGRGGGLGAAFGGGGSSAFGTRTGDVFTWVTIVLTGLFLLLAVGTSLVFRPDAGTVFAPQFVPEPTPIAEPTSVTLRCATPGASIRFTLDGSAPGKQANLYDRPITIEPGSVIKARAYRGKWEPSDVATAEYPVADANSAPPVPGTDDRGALSAPPTPAPPTATQPGATTAPAAGE